MNNNRMSLYEILIVLIVTVGVLVMAAFLYLDILIMQEATRQIREVEAQVAEIVEDVKDINESFEANESVIVEEPTVEYFDVPLDESLQDHIFAECEKYEVDPAVVIAMIERESRFNADVVGDSGRSFGLMQIQKRWHSGRMEKLGCDDLLDPYQNVTVGINFLAELIDYGKGVEWALMAYNGGPGYANKLSGKSIVSDYAAGVMACAERVGTRI